jgi:hypothetical protein
MQAGQIARLNRPAPERLTDTTEESHSLPALAVNSSQTDLEHDGVVQDCTAAARVAVEREQALVYDGGITTDRVEGREEVVSDVVADVTGTGLVVAERVAGSGRYPFPYDMIAAQTGRDLSQYELDIREFVEQFDDDQLRDTWMTGVDNGDGVSIDYNQNANRDDAPRASVGLGFSLVWNDVHAEGVVYKSGYVAIYSSWTAEVFLEFVDDAIMPVAHVAEDDGAQATLS